MEATFQVPTLILIVLFRMYSSFLARTATDKDWGADVPTDLEEGLRSVGHDPGGPGRGLLGDVEGGVCGRGAGDGGFNDIFAVSSWVLEDRRP